MPAVFALSWQCLGYVRKVFGWNHHELRSRHIHISDVLSAKCVDPIDQRERQLQNFSYNNLILSTGQTELGVKPLLDSERQVLLSSDREDRTTKEEFRPSLDGADP